MQGAVEAQDLVKTYPKDVRALDGVSFAVETGRIFGLLGPNGAGKSTTVKILTTLSRPDAGEARVAGHDVLTEAVRVRAAIGCVAQKSGVDRDATGRENLTLQGQVYGLGGRKLRQRVNELLEQLGLADAADRLARGYSGGMQRRLDIAMGLVHRPQVLFLAEPTTGLDPEVRRHVGRDLAPHRGRRTHDPPHHPLPRGGRPARVQARDRRSWSHRRRRAAQGLKSELRGDAVQVELGEVPPTGSVQAALATSPSPSSSSRWSWSASGPRSVPAQKSV